ncbi:hypothetical protein K3Z80_22260, partial [Pseudomonas aeruginosa]|nr:hypothetical protein [Pseudomonas aeruginosa]
AAVDGDQKSLEHGKSSGSDGRGILRQPRARVKAPRTQSRRAVNARLAGKKIAQDACQPAYTSRPCIFPI